MYAIHEFSRLTKGVLLKDKSAQSVVDGILDCWIFCGGMGPDPPSKYFFSDRGFEFINFEVLVLCKANDIILKNTSLYTPWQNRLNE